MLRYSKRERERERETIRNITLFFNNRVSRRFVTQFQLWEHIPAHSLSIFDPTGFQRWIENLWNTDKKS